MELLGPSEAVRLYIQACALSVQGRSTALPSGPGLAGRTHSLASYVPPLLARSPLSAGQPSQTTSSTLVSGGDCMLAFVCSPWLGGWAAVRTASGRLSAEAPLRAAQTMLTPLSPAPAPAPRPCSRAALCCPSRAAVLLGQCAHNSGIVSNSFPLGGANVFRDRGLETMTAPYLLQQAGYRTGLVGK